MMIQTNVSTMEFATVAHVNVEIMLLEIGVKSNRPIMATVILIITGLNLSMMVVTAVRVHASDRHVYMWQRCIWYC